MADISLPQLSAEGFDKCAEPIQVPNAHLREEYIKLREQISSQPATDPNTKIVEVPQKIGATEELYVDGQKRMTMNVLRPTDVSRLDHDEITYTDNQTNWREWWHSNAADHWLEFKTPDASGKVLDVGALIDGSKILHEEIRRPGENNGQTQAHVAFTSDGKADGAWCSNEKSHLTYSWNSVFDSNTTSAQVELYNAYKSTKGWLADHM